MTQHTATLGETPQPRPGAPATAVTDHRSASEGDVQGYGGFFPSYWFCSNRSSRVLPFCGYWYGRSSSRGDSRGPDE
jgi:hypothetical protein